MLPSDKATEEVDNIFKKLDQNGSGKIDYQGIFNNNYFRICYSNNRSEKIFQQRKTFGSISIN